MTRRSARGRTALVLALSAIALILGCTPVARPAPTEAPTFKPTSPVQGDVAIAGMKAALGPDMPIRLTVSANINIGNKVGKAAITMTTDAKYLGNEMEGTVKFRNAPLQLTFDVIHAGGKAFVRPLTHKWARSPAKVPPEGTGPFGDLKAAKMTFKGASKHDPRFYTIEWKNPIYLDRGLNGTLFTKVKITSS